jgi:hypothetical protein
MCENVRPYESRRIRFSDITTPQLNLLLKRSAGVSYGNAFLRNSFAAVFSRNQDPKRTLERPARPIFVVKFLLALQMQETSPVSFSGVFALRDRVSEEE